MSLLSKRKRDRKRAVERVAAKVAPVAGNVRAALELAAKNAELERGNRLLYAFLYRLVEDRDGPVEIPAAKYRNIPPTRRLDISTDADDTVTLRIVRK